MLENCSQNDEFKVLFAKKKYSKVKVFLLKYFNIVINIIINILNNVGSNTLKISLLHSEMYKYFFEIVTKIFFISN